MKVRGGYPAVLLGIAVAVAILAGVEALLRIVGFQREIAPVALRFGYPNPREITDLFRPDPRLFWRFEPGSVFDAEAPVPINAKGYRGPLPREPRAPGRLRVAVAGDSVAFGSASCWPEILAASRELEVLNFGVPGYSIVQGLRQLEEDIAPLRPDVVVIAYGWNDHWLARAGIPDAALRPPGPQRAAIALALSRLRIAQALRALLVRAPSSRGEVRRVPLPEYRELVRLFATRVQAEGARAIVVGLPSALAVGDVPEYLVGDGFTPSAAAAVSDHGRYLDAAREAAAAAGATFVDAAKGMGTDPRLFTGDRIHLSAEGHAALAALVGAAIP
ncbi:MAG TPA: SGNH/GDSL hydrolase family protein [Candidatus Bathyarchaeia archaeon]|nr:SGNH/GDSL hydrolase family protein [Candidatus Bathyarchaeia archaeon]